MLTRYSKMNETFISPKTNFLGTIESNIFFLNVFCLLFVFFLSDCIIEDQKKTDGNPKLSEINNVKVYICNRDPFGKSFLWAKPKNTVSHKPNQSWKLQVGKDDIHLVDLGPEQFSNSFESMLTRNLLLVIQISFMTYFRMHNQFPPLIIWHESIS